MNFSHSLGLDHSSGKQTLRRFFRSPSAGLPLKESLKSPAPTWGPPRKFEPGSPVAASFHSPYTNQQQWLKKATWLSRKGHLLGQTRSLVIFHLLKNMFFLFSLVGFKGNLSLLEIYFSKGSEPNESYWHSIGSETNIWRQGSSSAGSAALVTGGNTLQR